MRYLVPFIILIFLCFPSGGKAARADGEGEDLAARAGSLFMHGKWPEAAEAYKKLAEEEPEVKDLYRLAEAQLYSNYFADSHETFKRTLSVKKDDPYSIISITMLEAIKQKGLKGFDRLQALSEKYGDDYRYWRAVGLAFFHRDLHRKAIKFFKNAVRLNPDDYMSYFYTGLSYELHLDFDNAIKPYKKVVEINPNYAQAVNNLGYNYKERHYYTYAARMYEKAIELDPGHAGFFYNLGNVYNHWRMRRQAFYVHSRALELEPNFHKAHYNVGKNYIRFGFYEKGISHLKTYIKYWDPGLSERDVPNPKVVKAMIEDAEYMIEDREARKLEVEKMRKKLEELKEQLKESEDE
jgi:superkiller protein 3